MTKGKCPYCTGEVVEKDIVNHNYAQCAKCGIPHHLECYQQNNSKCAIMACGGKTISLEPLEITDLIVPESTALCQNISLDGLLESYQSLKKACLTMKNEMVQYEVIFSKYGQNISPFKKELLCSYLAECSSMSDPYMAVGALGGFALGWIAIGSLTEYFMHWGMGSVLAGEILGVPFLFVGAYIGSKFESPRDEKLKEIKARYASGLIEAKNGK